MSEREYYFNTKFRHYAVAIQDQVGEKDFSIFAIGETLNDDVADDLDDPEWIRITADNADLFIDEVARKMSVLNQVMGVLEGILD